MNTVGLVVGFFTCYSARGVEGGEVTGMEPAGEGSAWGRKALSLPRRV